MEAKDDSRPCIKCGKAAKMSCPTCIKLHLPPIPFCSQECFKASWSSHKALHNVGPLDFPGFKFTVKFGRSFRGRLDRGR